MTRNVAACLIAGDEWEEEEVEKMFSSIQPFVSGIFVAYNGKHKELPWQKYSDVKITQQKFVWEDDFSKARNQSFAMVPSHKFDWKCWIDTDDVFKCDIIEKYDEMFDSLDEYTKAIFIKYNYAIEPETGIVVVEQWRERFFSTDAEFYWLYPIHEVCKAKGMLQFGRREQCWIDHQRKSGEDRGARERNRRILEKAALADPGESRHYFYLAGETMAEADVERTNIVRKHALCDAAIDIFETFRNVRNSLDEDVYLATCRIAELNRWKEDYSTALQFDMEAIAIFPAWPDAFCGACKSLMAIKDWRRMKDFANLACSVAKPTTAVSIEPLNSSFTPLMLRGIANEELQEYDQAIRDYKEALKYWRPPNGSLEDKIDELKELKKKKPHEDLRKELRGATPEKSICFFTNPLVEVWHPKTLKEYGAGGAETCIIELSPYFKEEGYRTVVFGTPGEYRGVHEGVEYWNTEEWMPQEEFSVFVSSRSPFPFENNINSKLKLLWMHDVNLGEDIINHVNLPDKVLGLTNWHVNHLNKLYGIEKERLHIVPNGINIDRFKVDRSKDDSNDPKFIWLSSPDRGLDTLLSMWPLIKDRFPEATLEIYYGWAIIDKLIANFRSVGQTHQFLENYKIKVQKQMKWLEGEKAGITWKDRVPPDELAEALYRANFALFPTAFMETFCLAMVQCQAAGVIPITSNLAALSENVAYKDGLVTGWPSNSTYQRQFLSTLDIIINNKEEIVNARTQGRELALQKTWEHSFVEWKNLIETNIL